MQSEQAKEFYRKNRFLRRSHFLQGRTKLVSIQVKMEVNLDASDGFWRKRGDGRVFSLLRQENPSSFPDGWKLGHGLGKWPFQKYADQVAFVLGTAF